MPSIIHAIIVRAAQGCTIGVDDDQFQAVVTFYNEFDNERLLRQLASLQVSVVLVSLIFMNFSSHFVITHTNEYTVRYATSLRPEISLLLVSLLFAC